MAADSRYKDSNYAPQPTETISQGGTSGISQTSSSTRETTDQTTSSYAQNTPQFALDALQQLIAQLSEVPQLSPEQARALAPAPVMNERGVWTDPKTGAFLTEAQATTLRAQRVNEYNTYITGKRGGTQSDQIRLADRDLEIQRNRETQAKYSKESAFADAQNLTGYFTRKLMEEAMPSIVRGAEGAGTSQSTVRALLSEQAAGRLAENAASLGAQMSGQYGQINNQLAGVLELLTRSDPNSVTNQLLQALSTAKGTIQSSVNSTRGTSTKDTTATTVENKVQDELKLIGYDTFADDPIVAQIVQEEVKPTAGDSYGYIIKHEDPYQVTEQAPAASEDYTESDEQYFI